jgi:hypothetical protein
MILYKVREVLPGSREGNSAHHKGQSLDGCTFRKRLSSPQPHGEVLHEFLAAGGKACHRELNTRVASKTIGKPGSSSPQWNGCQRSVVVAERGPLLGRRMRELPVERLAMAPDVPRRQKLAFSILTARPVLPAARSDRFADRERRESEYVQTEAAFISTHCDIERAAAHFLP